MVMSSSKSFLLASSLALAACVSHDEPPPTAGDDVSRRAAIITLAEQSEQLAEISRRVAVQWPGLSVRPTSSHVIEDAAFNDGDLIGVYFPIAGAEPGSSASIWYDAADHETTLAHTALALITREHGAIHTLVAVDGAVQFAHSMTEGDFHTARGGGLATCLRACDGGVGTMLAFCRNVPPGGIRALCWAAAYGSVVFCKGFCYARF